MLATATHPRHHAETALARVWEGERPREGVKAGQSHAQVSSKPDAWEDRPLSRLTCCVPRLWDYIFLIEFGLREW
jgi:hypothetical protein